MTSAANPLRIFVAMPGTYMGPEATWTDIDEIKQTFLQPLTDKIHAESGHEVADPIIETDKRSMGPIYSSMFAEAVKADIYIADLSGANANVFLELGARWALADRVTILVTQDQGPLKFNVAGARVIRYGPKPKELARAIDEVTEAAILGLRDQAKIDSPVRESMEIVAVPRSELDGLRDELSRLRSERADELVEAARTVGIDDALELLNKAIARNPASFAAHFEYGVTLRRRAEYSDSETALRRAVRLSPASAEAWRELGVTLSKAGQYEESAEALEAAVNLDREDGEAWSNLAGLYRRIARKGGGVWDIGRLQQSRDAYEKASEITGNDTYPRVNAAKVNLLLAATDKQDGKDRAIEEFRSVELLARYSVEEHRRKVLRDLAQPQDLYWKLFDLIDCLLVVGDADDVENALSLTIDTVPAEERAMVFTSAMESWHDLILADVLDRQRKRLISSAIARCESLIVPENQDPPT